MKQKNLRATPSRYRELPSAGALHEVPTGSSLPWRQDTTLAEIDVSDGRRSNNRRSVWGNCT